LKTYYNNLVSNLCVKDDMRIKGVSMEMTSDRRE
jgi:hypothetical protein